MDATLSNSRFTVMAWEGAGRGRPVGGAYVQVEATPFGDVLHTRIHSNKQTNQQTNRHASSPETAVVLDYRIRN